MNSWKIRRRIIFAALSFCALVVSKIVLSETDSQTAQVALYGAFGLSASVIGSYVFGAVWDDNNVRKS